MIVAVFSSKSGSSEKYARLFASHVGCECFSAEDRIPGDGSIVFFGWVRGPTIVGLRSIDKSRLKAVCAVGLDSSDRFDKVRMADSNKVSVPIFYVRGWIDRMRLGFVDKTVLAFVSAVMKIRGLNQYNQPVFDAMMEGGSFFDESMLADLERFCSSETKF